MPNDTHFFLVKVRDGYESRAAHELQQTILIQHANIYSIMVPPNLKGFIIIEATTKFDIDPLLRETKHIRSKVKGKVPFEEVVKLLDIKVKFLLAGTMVEVMSGPFKGMTAKVISDNGKNIKILLLEMDYRLELNMERHELKDVKEMR
jgi:transcriptional antiterminator NusG